jgi:hypothetical protein
MIWRESLHRADGATVVAELAVVVVFNHDTTRLGRLLGKS